MIICQLIVRLLVIVQNKRTDKFELVTIETIVKKYKHNEKINVFNCTLKDNCLQFYIPSLTMPVLHFLFKSMKLLWIKFS